MGYFLSARFDKSRLTSAILALKRQTKKFGGTTGNQRCNAKITRLWRYSSIWSQWKQKVREEENRTTWEELDEICSLQKLANSRNTCKTLIQQRKPERRSTISMWIAFAGIINRQDMRARENQTFYQMKHKKITGSSQESHI